MSRGRSTSPNISNLREKVEMNSPSVIMTEPGVGYRLRLD
jgi:DNA-binding response OmpR family regulator